MRAIGLTVFVFLVVVTGAAHSQQAITDPPPAPLNPDSIMKYCIYANALYSIGAEICHSKGGAPLICQLEAGNRALSKKAKANLSS